MTEIYFIRHAESFGNLTRRAYGWFDGIVTEKGYKQIECLKNRFKNVNVDVVYSSDLSRTRETAKAIYESKGIPLICDGAFREVGIGVWEDRPWGEIPITHPEEYLNWSEKPLSFNVEGGETYAEVYLRSKTALDRIVEENDGKTIAVVSHGATLRMLMYGITRDGNLEDVEREDWGDNTCVSLFTYENGVYTEKFRNDNSHLSQMPNFTDNMRWVREGGGRNAWFKCADFSRDKQKIRDYHRRAWLDIFGDEPQPDREVDKKAMRVLRQSSENIVFAYCPDGEIGMIELDEDICIYPGAGHISVLYLNSDFRRKRYGIQLIGHAMSRYAALGKKHISVRVAETNHAAIEFYKKYGFYEAFREVEDTFRQIIMILDITAKGMN